MSQNEDCQRILDGGAFDESDFRLDRNLAIKLAQWMCDSRSQNYKTGGSFNFVDLFSAGGQSEADVWSKVCSSSDFSYAYKSAQFTKLRTASKVLVDAFNACHSSTKPGLFIGYAPGASANEFTLRLGFNSVAKEVRSADLTVQNAEEAGCPGRFIPKNLYPGQVATISCPRKDGDKAVTLVLNSESVAKFNDAIHVPAVPKAPVCDQKEPNISLLRERI
jgi:hypothetical protein